MGRAGSRMRGRHDGEIQRRKGGPRASNNAANRAMASPSRNASRKAGSTTGSAATGTHTSRSPWPSWSYSRQSLVCPWSPKSASRPWCALCADRACTGADFSALTGAAPSPSACRPCSEPCTWPSHGASTRASTSHQAPATRARRWAARAAEVADEEACMRRAASIADTDRQRPLRTLRLSVQSFTRAAKVLRNLSTLGPTTNAQ